MAKISTHLTPAQVQKLAAKRGADMLMRAGVAIATEAKRSMKGGGSDPESHEASAPGSPPNIFKGILRNSIKAVKESPKRVIVGPTVRAPYARILEFGGVILPRRAKALAMPVYKKAFGRSPREFAGLEFIPGEGGRGAIGYLVGPEDAQTTKSLRRQIGKTVTRKGKTFSASARATRKRTVIWYVLLGKAVIAPRPYMRPAVRRIKQQWSRLFAREGISFGGSAAASGAPE